MVEKNRYVAEYLPTVDFDKRDVIAFIVKRTYKLDTFEGRLEPLEEQPPVAIQDEPHDDDADAPSVKFEADFVPFKPKVDIVFVGKAYAPGGKPSPEFECALRVGPYRKRLRILGPRKARYVPPEKQPKIDKKTGLPKDEIIQPPPLFTAPEPIAEVELRMSNAYGGASVVVPADEEAFKKAIEDAKKDKEEKEKKKEEDAKKEAEEEKKKAEDEKKKPDAFFGGAGGAEKGADGALKLDDPLAPIQEEPEEAAAVDVKALRDEWGKVGTAGEVAKSKDGATMAIDLSTLGETLEAVDLESEYRKSAAGQAAPEEVVEQGGTRALKIGDMVEVEDADWAARERENLSEADRARRDALEEARRKAKAEEDKGWPIVTCPQNPVGKGFAIHNLPETIDGIDLPLIEDPARPLRPEDIPRELSSLMDQDTVVMPAGMGWFSKTWWPRTSLAGVMPHEKEETQRKVDEHIVKLDPSKPDDRAQLESLVNFEVPVMQPAYYNGAMPGLQVDKLVGDEDVHLVNLDAAGNTLFKLPGDYPHVLLDRGRGKEPILVHLDTLVIDREDEKVTMVWRGHLPYGGFPELETYLKFDIDIKESDVEAYREIANDLARKARESDRGTQAIDLAQIEKEAAESEAEKAYRAHVDETAGGAAKAAALATGAAAVHDGGTKALDLAEIGEEKVVTDGQFHGWADDAVEKKEQEFEGEESAAEKKAKLKKRLEEMKKKEEEEAAAAAAAAEEAAQKKKK